MKYYSLSWLAILTISMVGVSLVTYFEDVHPVLRTLVIVWFLLVCPGMAFILLLRLKDSLAIWVLAIALSLALDVLVAGTMVYAGRWSIEIGLIALSALTLLGALMQFIPWRPRGAA